MGKPTKNDTGSGGDERDERKIRAGSNPSKASSSSVVKRLGDNESSRSKTGVRASARQSNAGRSGVKQPHNVTVHSPLIKGSGQATNRASVVAKPPTSNSNKEVKKPNSETGVKTKSQSAKMKQESENSDHKPVDDVQESSGSAEAIKQQAKESSHTDEQQSAGQHKNGLSGDEPAAEKNGTENGNAKDCEKSSKQNGGDASSERDDEFKLHLDTDDQSSSQADDELAKESSEVSKDEESQSNVKLSADEATEESQTDTESCSVDVVESTTSELSEATESTAPSEIKDGDSQDANADDAVLDATRQECTVQLMDVLKDPTCAGLIKAQNDPLERRINTRSKSKSRGEDGEAAGNNPETPQKAKPSDYKQIRARRSLRPGHTYQSPSIHRSLNVTMDESGPSNRNDSDHYLSLSSESPATSTNGSTSTSGLKKANLLRRTNDAAPLEGKKQKLAEDVDKEPPRPLDISRINRSIKPVTLGRWCSIM